MLAEWVPDMETIRLIHHWACSGGTLISRCLAALPRVLFLSEVHPYAFLVFRPPKVAYLPTDLIRQLSTPLNGASPSLCLAAFNGAVDGIQRQATSQKLALVIRCHSHIDFFIGAKPSAAPLVSEQLGQRWPLEQLVTVRHPLDSWLSITASGWHDQLPYDTLEGFCQRCLQMLEACSSMPWVRYEDFCLDPEAVLRNICTMISLDLDVSVLDRFDQIEISGDSGRRGAVITPRDRPELPPGILNQARSSKAYGELCERLGYQGLAPSAYPPAPFPPRWAAGISANSIP
jgi:hypothetical protein